MYAGGDREGKMEIPAKTFSGNPGAVPLKQKNHKSMILAKCKLHQACNEDRQVNRNLTIGEERKFRFRQTRISRRQDQLHFSQRLRCFSQLLSEIHFLDQDLPYHGLQPFLPPYQSGQTQSTL